MSDTPTLLQLARLVRYYILTATTAAGSGHPTSSLSATDLMVACMFGGYFQARLDEPQFTNNDRLIFSKGHAAPLLYSLYAAAGKVSEDELKTLRQFTSTLEGHPTMEFPYTEVPTGSLGQGLSVAVGYGLNAKYVDKLSYYTYVLLGDSEMAEGSIWEAAACASYYKLHNIIAIADVNRLGQRGETMYGHHTEVYEARFKSFGWHTICIDGHAMEEIQAAFTTAKTNTDKPTIIIAKTIKGKGVSFLEDKDGWHGKALSTDEYTQAIAELGPVTKSTGTVAAPEAVALPGTTPASFIPTAYDSSKAVSTRKAYGNALSALKAAVPNLIVLDAETSNSTYAETIKKTNPETFFEMFIAEQNMVGTALGFSARGKVPFVSTFSAFFSRAFDQIRMSQYANSNIKFVGSHAGVSIGEDGASQMGLEEIAMFRTLHNAVVLYPSDAISTERLLLEAAQHHGNVYIQTTRMDTPMLYTEHETFPIGGSKTVRSSSEDLVTVIGAGVTLHEALKAYELLQQEHVTVRIIDLYSIKPIDTETILKATSETKGILVVEDHYLEGGIGDAVAQTIAGLPTRFKHLAVRKMPRSGKPAELLAYEQINATAIVQAVKEVIAG